MDQTLQELEMICKTTTYQENHFHQYAVIGAISAVVVCRVTVFQTLKSLEMLYALNPDRSELD